MSYDTLRAKIEQLIEKAQLGGEGESIQYTDVICNDDDTVTLIDTNGIEHTITCVYENNRLTSMTYDGKEVVTVYDFGKLVAVGETEVDVSNTPLDNTIEALIDKSGVLESTDGTAAEKVEQVVDKAVDGNLWYIASGKITSFANGGTCSCFTNWAYSTLPKTDFSNTTSLTYAISYTQLEYIDYYINSAKCTNFNSAFSNNKKLKWIVGVDLSSATTIHNLFMQSAIETIQEPLNIAKVTNANFVFQECKNLKYIRFVAECIKVSIAFPHSSLLTAESIQSIIDGLATVETAQTLTLHADVKAKLTEEQLATITSKNWNLA